MAIRAWRVRNLGRIGKVVNILLQNGFEGVVETTGLRRFLPKDHRVSDKDSSSLNRWQRIRRVVEELGPTMVAFADYLACRPDILPEPLITELAQISSSTDFFTLSPASLSIFIPSDASLSIIIS